MPAGQELGDVYTEDELGQMLGSVGSNVSINRSVVFYSPRNVHIGSNVRIDCFGIISAGAEGILIEDHVHISFHCCLIGSGGKIHLEAFTGVASRSTLYTSTDDFTEGFLTGPTIPGHYRKVTRGNIIFRKHSLVGSGTVVLPGVTLGVGSAVGALSLVKKDVPDYAIVAGNPVRILGQRSRLILEREREFLEEKRRMDGLSQGGG